MSRLRSALIASGPQPFPGRATAALANQQSRQRRHALPLKRCSRPPAEHGRVNARAAETQMDKDAVSAQTGQSLPQTTRPEPKLSMACSTNGTRPACAAL